MITLLSGIQLLTIGLLGEYVGKGYLETKQRPIFVVCEVLEACPDTASRHAEMTKADAAQG